jgi:hypothetical protein
VYAKEKRSSGSGLDLTTNLTERSLADSFFSKLLYSVPEKSADDEKRAIVHHLQRKFAVTSDWSATVENGLPKAG